MDYSLFAGMEEYFAAGMGEYFAAVVAQVALLQ
jgi:hypothetical protein